MDAKLRAYLERPPPRPSLGAHRYDDRHLLWMFPLGAALSGALVIVQVVASRRDLWPYGALAWGSCVLLAFWAGRTVHGLRRSLFRNGTLGTARICSSEVHDDGESLSLSVVLEVFEVRGEAAHPYRANGSGSPRTYRIWLSDRWLCDGAAPALFEPGATLPILMSATKRDALIFVSDEEEIDAVQL